MKILFDHQVEMFIASLEKPAIAKVLRAIDLLECFGCQLGLPQSKKVKNNLFELRIRGQREVQIFYTFKDGMAILFHGFIKKSQKIPKQELGQAIRKLRDLT